MAVLQLDDWENELRHPITQCYLVSYKSKQFKDVLHTYNALEELWSCRQFSQSEAFNHTMHIQQAKLWVFPTDVGGAVSNFC